MGQNKSRNLLCQKNHATSQVKKNKSTNLLAPKKSLATSWHKKIRQPLITKKSHNLSTKKSHATSRHKKSGKSGQSEQSGQSGLCKRIRVRLTNWGNQNQSGQSKPIKAI